MVTPIRPREWRMLWDGEAVSLYPSVGNKRFTCRSHYWLKNNLISWLPPFTDRDLGLDNPDLGRAPIITDERVEKSKALGFWARVRGLFSI